MGRGDTLIKALQDAVPEDVRGKLTTAVSGIMQSSGPDLKFDKLLQLGSNNGEAPGSTSKVLHKDVQPKVILTEDVKALDNKKKANGLVDGNSGVDHRPSVLSGDKEAEKQAPEILQKQSDLSPDLGKGSNNEIVNSSENTQASSSTTVDTSDKENTAEVNKKQDSSASDGPDGVVDIPTQTKVETGTDKGQPGPTIENNQLKNDFSNEQDKPSESSSTGENSSAPPPTPEEQVPNNEADNSQEKAEKDPMSTLSQTMSDSPSFSVSQAFNALTGFDDSTQVAVNSVFNVIEGMIDQLEVKKDDVVDEAKNQKNVSVGNGVGKVNDFTESSVDIDIKRSQVETEGEISSIPTTSRELSTKNNVKYLNSSSELVPNSNFLYSDPLYQECLKTYLSLKMKNVKPPGTSKPSAYLDYIPEEGQWKLLEQTEDDIGKFDEYAASGSQREGKIDSHPISKNSDNTIEPSYVIVDSSNPEGPYEELEKGNVIENAEFDETKSYGSAPFIKSLILECLEIEVGRRISVTDGDDLELKLAKEMEDVADAVSMVAGKGKHHMEKLDENLPGKYGILDGEDVVRAISSAVQDTEYLRTVLPIGVIVGSSLAALRKFFDVAALDDDDEQNLGSDHVDEPTERHLPVDEKESNQRPSGERQNKDNSTSSTGGEDGGMDLGNSEVLMGAVTAALGASALIAHQHVS